MSTLKLALRNTFRKNNGNIVKILSLGIGLTIGMVLIAKILFELSYDSHYPESNSIYAVYSNFAMGDSEMEPFDRTSGAVAWAMKNEISEVENATRFTYLRFNDFPGIYTENRGYLSAETILADENFFDILYRPILLGNAKNILSSPMQCLVSKSMAEKIGMEDIVGKTITIEFFPSKQVLIAGVFEDNPENSTHKYDVVISLISISNFLSYDGSENWLGNERYYSFVKLTHGVNPKSLANQVRAMQERNVDMEMVQKAGVNVDYLFMKINEMHTNDSGVKILLLVFGLLAFVLLATAILNYTLVVIASLVGRTKEIAVHKCYGATGINISKLLFSETLIHLILALIFSWITIVLLESTIVQLLQVSLKALFAPQILWILALVCTILLLITGLLPAYLFSKIPVSAAFQKTRETHRKWKLVLIFLEVAATSFIITLLVMIGLQYKKHIHEDQGYAFKNVLYVENINEDPATKNMIMQELKKLAAVKNVSICSQLPIAGASGNNITEVGKETHLFNIADLEEVDANFLSVLEIPVIEGRGFVKGETGNDAMMVSESFVEKMAELAGWTDGVVDKSVWVSYHGEKTICGVFGNILLSSDGFSRDTRPAIIVFDPDDEEPGIFLIKMHDISHEIIRNISAIFQQFVPEQNILIRNYEENFKENFSTIKVFRSGMLICSIVTLLLVLIGLIGYIHNETNRRRAEIAIRKVHGATTNSIQGLFLANILKPVIPAILIGIIAAVVVAKFIQHYFVDKVHISIFVYTLCAVGIVSVILAVVSLNIYRAAARNPVENIEN